MDRNFPISSDTSLGDVALRKESVDRNDIETSRVCTDAESLSARRAWIEIALVETALRAVYVALRKESVDRNGV